MKAPLMMGLLIHTTLLNAEVTDYTSNFGQCLASTTVNASLSEINKNPSPDAIYLEADQGTIIPDGISVLSGNVIIQQNQTQFNADSASFDRSSNHVTAKGNAVLTTKELKLKSPLIHYDLNKQTGIIEQAEYSMGGYGVHGTSSQIKKVDKDNLRLKDATYTSCPVSIDSWHLASSEIKLNNKTQIGNAKNVTFKVGKVPVFYFPWLRFPLNNQRFSGFLSPSIRLQSNAGISIPYYFNLAPNYDATLKLITLKDRGYQLDTQFRYITKEHQGSIEYNFLPEDKSFNNEKRDYFLVNHHTTLSETNEINLIAEGVSDKDFIDDSSTSLETSIRPALERRLEFVHNNKAWHASAALEDFQVLDLADAPYAKLPELKLSYTPKTKPKELKVDVHSEITFFDKDNAVAGTRSDLKVNLSKKWGNDAWYFKPKVSLQHTLYSLSSLDSDNRDTSLSRTLPTLSIDSGIFLDRNIKDKYVQTLEPRLFYTYTPFKDQSDFPVFDTVRTDFSTSNLLFRENRFTGKDRIADTNQLTFALSSRIQNRQSGKELIKASIGQIINFSDRKVTLPGGTIQTGKRSDLVLELSGRLNDNFRLTSVNTLNSENRKASSFDLRLNYKDEKNRIANLSFRKLDTELKQVSFSTSLPINDKWSFVGSVDQDIKNHRNLEVFAGLEYQDCCWKTRLVMKRYLTSDNITYETPIFLEFELKGLGNIGNSATRQIQDKIYGYDD
ncbi:MAG: LPS assembly protein LptD [Cocleimonas sp.]